MEELLKELINKMTEQIANKVISYLKQHINNQEEIFDVKGLSKFLKVPESWIYDKVRFGELPYHKVGHYTRFLKSEIMEWLKTGKLPQPKKIKKAI